jgi:biofilm PGA synthesis N-glycosyltransferase PgaC
MKKFVLCLLFSLAWVLLSYNLAIPWINDVSNSIGYFLSFLIISGIAFVPAFAMAFVYSTLLTDKRVKKNEKLSLPPISILIAAYNEQDTILNTLKSIDNQDYLGDIQVIICNDGSIDKTAEVVNNFIKDNENKHVDYNLLTIEKNAGKSNALNQGLKKSNYDNIITIDADSILYKDALKSIVQTLYSCDNNTVAVAGTILVNNSKESLMTKIQYWDYLLGISSVKQSQSSYNGTLVAQGAFSIYKKNVLLEIGGWSNTVGEDIVLTWDMLKRDYNIYHDTEAICFTNVPSTYKQYFKQRKRWARGLIEAFKRSYSLLFKPRKILPFIWYNLLFPYIDVTFSFIFIPSIIAALFFNYYLLAGYMTLLIIPLGLILNVIIYKIQKRTFRKLNLKIKNNLIGLILFVLFYQIILVPATISGYFSELLNLKKNWGTK